MDTKLYNILVLNPGSTSTKIGVYQNDRPILIKKLHHDPEDLNQCPDMDAECNYRRHKILEELASARIPLDELNAVVARGGLIRPIPSGIYEVNDRMINDLRASLMGKHASNLGGLIAAELIKSIPDSRAYIADPVVVDELQDVARIAGHPKFKRISIFHALNQKAVARRHAHSINRSYEEINLIVAHLGGGISVGAHRKGSVVDVNNALDGDGPFSPERSGSIPARQLLNLAFDGNHTQTQIAKMIAGEGGLVAYFGTNDAYSVAAKARNGDPEYLLIQNAMAYQTGKAIGEAAAVLQGDVDAILITGGIANNRQLCDYIRNMVKFIAPVIVYPGEDELAALAANGLMVLSGQCRANEY
jgi:butyrate kinase